MIDEDPEGRLAVCVDRDTGAVDLRGELDLSTAELLVEQFELLVDVGVGRIEVDMSGVEFCDSSGLNGLLNLRRRLDAEGIRLRVLRPSAQVARLFALTGLTGLVDDGGADPRG